MAGSFALWFLANPSISLAIRDWFVPILMLFNNQGTTADDRLLELARLVWKAFKFLQWLLFVKSDFFQNQFQNQLAAEIG